VLLFLWYCRRPVCLQQNTRRELTVFTYRELQSATKNFSERLGGGGFGSVFKGTLTDGSLVAVKKLEGVNQGEKQFRMEVSTIGTIQHVNLVRLRGFCTEGSRRLLVYEYMPNGSLSSSYSTKPRAMIRFRTRCWTGKRASASRWGLPGESFTCTRSAGTASSTATSSRKTSSWIPISAPRWPISGWRKLLGREYSKVLTTMRGTRGYLAPSGSPACPSLPRPTSTASA
jgi:hypothetical protein